MKKNNKYQEALNSISSKIFAYMPSYVTSEDKNIQTIQELVDKEKYIELGKITEELISKPCYSSEDEESIYLELKKKYDSWLEKYED